MSGRSSPSVRFGGHGELSFTWEDDAAALGDEAVPAVHGDEAVPERQPLWPSLLPAAHKCGHLKLGLLLALALAAAFVASAATGWPKGAAGGPAEGGPVRVRASEDGLLVANEAFNARLWAGNDKDGPPVARAVRDKEEALGEGMIPRMTEKARGRPSAVEGRSVAQERELAPSKGVVKEKPGYMEYLVVAGAGLPVRSHRSLVSHVLGTCDPGALVIGEQLRESTWFQFLNEQKFAPTTLNGRQLLKKADVVYSKLAEAGCEAEAKQPILDKSVCEAAARTLGEQGVTFAEVVTGPVNMETGLGDAKKTVQTAELKRGCYLSPKKELLLVPETSPGSQDPPPDWYRLCLKPQAGVAVSPTSTCTTEQPHSLFCWCGATSGMPGQQYSEIDLLRAAYRHRESVFGCEDWMVFSNEAVQFGNAEEKATVITGADVFFEAWRQVLANDKWKLHPWTAKVDADAVFIPERLRWHMKVNHFNPWARTYFNNCAEGRSMLGPIQVFSHRAMLILEARFGQCKTEIASTKIGEGTFLQECAALLGVKGIDDFSLLDDAQCDSVPGCNNGYTVAFHPYDDIAAYESCLGQVLVSKSEAWVGRMDEAESTYRDWRQSRLTPSTTAAASTPGTTAATSGTGFLADTTASSARQGWPLGS